MRYLLMCLLVFALAACDKSNQLNPTPDPTPIPEPTPEPNPTPEPEPNPEPEPEPEPSLPSSSLDESFGDGGKVTFPGNRFAAMDVQADGKIVTLSITEREEDDGNELLYTVRRFNSDGTPDKGFANAGEFIAEEVQEIIDASFADAEAITVTDAGRICFVGSSTRFVQELGFQDFPVVGCLTPEGEPDTAFDGDGFAFPKSSLSGLGESISAADIGIDPITGDLVIGGTIFPDDTERAFWLFRMAADGDPNGEGKGKEIIVRFPEQDADFRSLTFLPSGDILALGSVGVPFTGEGGFDTAIARINKDGLQQINVFDFQPEKNDFGSKVIVDEQGRAVLAVNLQNSGFDSRGVLARLKPETLELDPSFGDAGVVRTSVFAEHFATVALDAEGRILTAGATFSVAEDDDDTLVTRFLENGEPDATFGNPATPGRISFNFDNEGDEADQILLDPNRNIVLLGTLDDDFLLARLNP